MRSNQLIVALYEWKTLKSKPRGIRQLDWTEILPSINLILWILLCKRRHQPFMSRHFLMVRLPYWSQQKVRLCYVLVHNVLNLRQEHLIVKLRKSHLSTIPRQTFSILIFTQIHSVVIFENLFQCVFLGNLVDWEETCHTTDNNLVNFVFVQQERFLLENCVDQMLNALC